MNYPYFSSNIAQVSVEELAEILEDQESSIQLIDVREREEVEIASLPRFTILPLSEFGEWSKEIKSKFNPTEETIVICHHGVRSAQMCQWLQNNGFTSVKNVSGGIDAYSVYIDRNIARY
jgi:rhodanese-related sulfurtransferase